MSTSTVPVPATPPSHRRQQSTTSLPSPSPSSPSSSKSKNYHPYLIHSTASSVLTSSNASPTPPPVSYLKHRPSRSMSSLAEQALSPPPGPGGIDVAKEKEREANRRRSMESPGPGSGSIRRGIRNGALPTFLEERDRGSPMAKAVVLPSDPKSWTPGELATYLGQTLRTGGPDGAGKILPAPLVEDIKTWVLRQQVTGRVFLRGNADSWSTSGRAPPFLPLLLSLSRKLRRTSLQRPSLGGAHDLPLETDEEDENENEEEEEEVSGVRRMANLIEMRDSASSASEMSEDEGRLRHLSSGSGGWERWGLRPQHTGSSVGSASGDSPASRSTSFTASGGEEDHHPKPSPLGAGPSPPPPYSPLFEAAAPSPAHRAINQSHSNEGTPKADKRHAVATPDGRGTPSRSTLSVGAGDSLCPSPGESPAPSTDATPNKYGSLRGKGRVRRVRDERGDGYDSSDEAPGSALRKVTIRPSIHPSSGGIFDGDVQVNVKSEREVELEKQLADVLDRVKKLEEERVGPRPGSVGAWLGAAGEGYLPDRVSDLPAYLILVGVGVGAMVLRVMMSRRS